MFKNTVLPFIFIFIFLLHLPNIPAATSYKPTDFFLLSCGSTSSDTPFQRRNWDTDATLKFLPPNMADISSPATASQQDPSVDRIPYLTARIFHSKFTYNFPLSPGPKFLRLYFYPTTYSGNLNTSQSFFTVTANNYIILSNFSAFLTVSASKSPKGPLIKEFIVNVKDSQRLNLTFSHSSNSNYSFINGIEIVSMPNNLYLKDHDSDTPLELVSNRNSLFNFDVNNSAFETLYRLNVGGSDVSVVDDTGMFRHWSMDDDFIIYGAMKGNPMHYDTPINYTQRTPSYTAPQIVYSTARALGMFAPNLTWIFPVDSGFYYMIRLHFCEINPNVFNTQNQRVFQITMNNKTAEPEFDVIYQSGGTGIPIYRDYVIWVPHPSDGRLIITDMWLSLFPKMDSKPEYADAILNGLEIFKLNSSDGNLAGVNPELSVIPNTPELDQNGTGKENGKSRKKVYSVIGGVVGASAVLLILGFLIFRRERKLKDLESTSKSSWAPLSTSPKSTKTNGSSLPSNICRSFSLQEVKSATGDFSDSFVIGKGGFGNVYKGYIDDGTTLVAIKRLNPSSNQGAHEFTTEIEMLSKLRHVHLVALIGYCDEQGEMILVYEYVTNGTLRDHLYKTENPPMTWKQRLQIVIGAAKGLHYLHAGAKYNIIHRDVKSTNILLDEKWVAKVSDFGLSKIGPTDGTDSHVSTVVKGSLGYVDPEYYKKQQLTDKSDVYSFGVVLFEVLCARPAVIPGVPKEQVSLAEWARRSYKNGSFNEIIDGNLKGVIAGECLRNYTEIAINCLKDRGIERPAMNDVVWKLEFALELQEAAEKNGNLDNPQYPLLFHGGQVTTTDDEVFSGTSGESMAKSNSNDTTTSSSDRLKSETIFSEIMNPAAR